VSAWLRRDGFVAFDFADVDANFGPSCLEFVLALQIHPELRRRPKERRKTNGRIAADADFLSGQSLDTGARHPARLRHGKRAQTKRNEKFFAKNFAGVHRRQFLSRHLALHFLVIVRDFDIFRSRVRPRETDAELIVDPDGVSTLSIAAQFVQSVARRLREVSQRAGRVKHLELAAGRRHEAGREPLLGKYPSATSAVILSLNDLIATPSRPAANRLDVSYNDTAIKGNVSIYDTFDGSAASRPRTVGA